MHKPTFFEKRLRKVIKTEIQHDYLGTCIFEVKKTGIALKSINQMTTHFWSWETLMAHCCCAACNNYQDASAVITFEEDAAN